MKYRLAWLTPLVAVAAAGCFATSNDVKIMQAHIDQLQRTVETSQADANKARLAELQRDSVMSAAIHSLVALEGSTRDSVRTLADSVRVFMDLFSRFKADVSLSESQLAQTMYSALAQLGASQKQIADMQRGFDAQRESGGSAPSDTGKRGAVSGGMPGPSALYQTGIAQLQKGSTSGARDAFQDLIKTYPTHALVAEATYQIAETYTREGNDGVADSIYKSVVDKFPKSQYAPTALWKRAQALEKAGQPRAAKALYTQIVHDYPKSDESPKASERLKDIPPA